MILDLSLRNDLRFRLRTAVGAVGVLAILAGCSSGDNNNTPAIAEDDSVIVDDDASDMDDSSGISVVDDDTVNNDGDTNTDDSDTADVSNNGSATDDAVNDTTDNGSAEDAAQDTTNDAVTEDTAPEDAATDDTTTDDTTEDTTTDDDSSTSGDEQTDTTDGADQTVMVLPVCITSDSDSDGDGFGFENGQSCTVVAQSTDTESDTDMNSDSATDSDTDMGAVEDNDSTTDTDASEVAPLAECVSADSDSDGDGYGFENGMSCLVNVVSDEQSGSDQSDTDGVASLPVCSTESSDSDGDGYGFENGVSCLVQTMEDDGDDMQTDMQTDAPMEFPACESDSSDSDGDGFGFENGVSCLVATSDSPEDIEDDIENLGGTDERSRLFEDFSQPLSLFSEQDRTTDGATSDFEYDDGVATVTVESTTTERERGRFVPRGRFDSFSALVALEPESVATGEGRAQVSISTVLYNDTGATEAGSGGDCTAGDIGVQLINRRVSSGDTFLIFNAFRETQSECGNTEEPPIFDGTNFLVLEEKPELGVSYRLGIAIDRENKILTMSIDDQDYNYPILTDVFPAGSPFNAFETRVERGPGTVVGRWEEIGVNGQSFDFNDPERLFDRFTFWDAGDPGTDISTVNGELRLESATSSNNRGENRMAITGFNTRYASAQMRVSSESMGNADGVAMARLGGSMFYASEEPGTRSAQDQVFAVTEIQALGDGTTDARYCAWQSLNDDFSSDISLVNLDDESGCNTFSLAPVVDENYTVATWMDDENRRIVFSINDEVHYQDIEGPISIGEDLFEMRVQSRAFGEGTKAVVYVDNLEMAPGAAPQ